MRPKTIFRVVLFIIALLLSSMACQTVTNLFSQDTPLPADPYIQPVDPNIPLVENNPPTEPKSAANLTCPAVTDNVLAAATQVEDDTLGGDTSGKNEGQYLVTYTVSGDQISDPYFENISSDLTPFQQDETAHREIWKYFTTLIPTKQRSVLTEFSIMTDGIDNTLAAVSQTYNDPGLWLLEVDILDAADKLDLTYTLIHEFAHLLTLGPNQVTPSLAVFNYPDDESIYTSEVNTCPQYFPGEGCAHSGSYINAFYHLFWDDIYAEFQDINLIENDDQYYAALDDFYYKYEDRFVTDYAVTNPEEDIAESFTFFVLSSRPAGNNIAEEKILFFYNYPELVQLRDQIISGICILNQ